MFFSDNLASVLVRYDHDLTYYIGGIPENVAHAYDMAYGNGGFTISYPLAARLVELMDGCLEIA